VKGILVKQKILKLTKLDAAKYQIDTAVWLWFHEGDPVSIHTLTGAANRIILDLSERQGETCLPFDIKLMPKGREKEAKILLRKHETFFKHAKNDPDDVLDFDSSASEMYLFFTVLGLVA
jgi:hypothetical protein